MPLRPHLHQQLICDEIEERLIVAKLNVALGLRRLTNENCDDRREFTGGDEIVEDCWERHVIRRGVPQTIKADEQWVWSGSLRIISRWSVDPSFPRTVQDFAVHFERFKLS